VRAVNAVGASGWALGDFATALYPPGGVALLAPGNGAGVLAPVTLRWSAVGGTGTRYWVQIARDPGFAQLETNADGLALPSVSFTRGVSGVQYWWRVRSWNAAGTAEWTPAWSFTVARPGTPIAPTILAPLDGASGLPLQVLLKWTATANTSGYAIEVALDPGFTQCVARTDALRGTSVGLMKQLKLGTTYYWHVAAWNANGKGLWSPTAAFTTALSQ
jgi:hypothetical protein